MERECVRCNQAVKAAPFCTACGCQLAPLSGGTLDYCAAREGSAEKAWRAFGFADANASNTWGRARTDIKGDTSAEQVSSQAFAAASIAIGRDLALPTAEESRAMGVESVVEGAEWDLSMKQLQVLSLSRSGALRGRRRSRASLPRERPQDALEAETTEKSVATHRRAAEGNARGGRAAVDRALCGGGAEVKGYTFSGTERQQERQGHVVRGSSGRSASGMVLPSQHSVPEAAAHEDIGKSPIKNSSPLNCGAKRPHEGQERQTEEQTIAIARGGVRRGRVVFHRKGVKLKPDSPRSMLPREVFRPSEPNLLATKGISIGYGRNRRHLVASLSAVVRVAAGEAAAAVGNGEATPANRPSGALQPDARCFDYGPLTGLRQVEKHTCNGLRLEVYMLPGSARCVEPGDECHASTDDGGCYRKAPAIFAYDLTHAEVDAFVGPALSWKDPFEEDTHTIRELESSWAACLDALSRRLRAIVPTDDQTAESAYSTDTDNGCHNLKEEKPPKGQGVAAKASNGPRPVPATLGCTSESPSKRSEPATMSLGSAERRGSLQGSSADATEVEGAVPSVAGKPRPPLVPVTAAGCDAARQRAVLDFPGELRAAGKGDVKAYLRFDRTLVRVGARVPWGRTHRGRFAKVFFTVTLGEACRGLEFKATSFSPTGDPMLRGRWDYQATDRDLARYLSPVYGAATGGCRRERYYTYDPQRCAVELQERRELEWACTVLAQKAFRLVLMAPGGVVLSLAGGAKVGGSEVAWPQDTEQDRAFAKASIKVQRSWRGWRSRKRTRWVRMEREGRRRLSRLREEVQAERERARALEARENEAKERRTRAQTVLATAVRTWVARQVASRRRTEQIERQHRLQQEAGTCIGAGAAGQIPENQQPMAAEAASLLIQDGVHAGDGSAVVDKVVSNTESTTTIVSTITPGVSRIEKVVTIDGTEVELTAHIKEAVGGADKDIPSEMLLEAVDKKARRSSRLALKAADIGIIVGRVLGAEAGQGGGGGSPRRPLGVFSTVLKALTVFNSRRKDLFILSYKGKQVVAPH